MEIEEVKRFFEKSNCECILNFALGKTSFIEAVDDFTYNEDGIRVDFKDFTIFEFENISSDNNESSTDLVVACDMNDSAFIDFCDEANWMLSIIKYLFAGYRFGAEEAIRSHNPNITKEEIDAIIKDKVLKTLRVDFFSFLSDEEFEKIYDNEWIEKKLQTFHEIDNCCR